MFFEFAAAKGSRQMTSSAASRARPRGFATTRWSLIQQANQGNEAPARAPMEELCQAYWLPVYAFMRRQTRDVHEAQDWTQGFLASLLSRDSFAQLSPEHGRFRSFLLAAARHFPVTNETKRTRLFEVARSFCSRSIMNMANSGWHGSLQRRRQQRVYLNVNGLTRFLIESCSSFAKNTTPRNDMHSSMLSWDTWAALLVKVR